jgi:hypothetical protein
MATFQTVAEIERAINRGLEAVAKDSWVIDGIKNELHRSIYENVYSFPEGGYRRRYDEGGLGDKEFFVQTDGKVKSPGEAEAWAFSQGDFWYGTAGVDSEGFMTVNAPDTAQSSITITIEDTAPGSGKGAYRLDELVEKGIGKGNMAIPRPFYKPEDDLIMEHAETIEIIVATIINNYL